MKQSRMIYGAMGLGGGWKNETVAPIAVKQAEEAFYAAVEIGINFFDFADIYQNGKSEEVFGEVCKNDRTLRSKLKIQSKAGIFLKHTDGIGRYDFSDDHIVGIVKKSLKRLNTDYLDSLLLHRPDPLMDRRELKKAFDYLFDNGMIRKIGVSNMNQYQIEFIENAIGRRIFANQLELSLKRLDWVDATIGVNNDEGFKSSFTPGLMEYMMDRDIEIQAWSPVARGIYSGRELEENVSETIINTKKLVYKIAEHKNTTPSSVVVAFLLKHPAGIRPVIGTTNPTRIRELADAEEINLSRKEWYELYITSRGEVLP